MYKRSYIWDVKKRSFQAYASFPILNKRNHVFRDAVEFCPYLGQYLIWCIICPFVNGVFKEIDFNVFFKNVFSIIFISSIHTLAEHDSRMLLWLIRFFTQKQYRNKVITSKSHNWPTAEFPIWTLLKHKLLTLFQWKHIKKGKANRTSCAECYNRGWGSSIIQ